MAARAGHVHHGYCLERRVGSGGFSEVWSARHVATGRPVALKLARPPISEHLRLRLRREVAVHAHVRHPRVCAIEEALPNEAGIAFALLEGGSLTAHVTRHGAMSDVGVLAMAHDLLGALEAVHGAGVVHRDVTPDNIVFARELGEATLIDFGLAKVGGDATWASSLTTEDAALGSYVHQAPEQLDDPRAVDGRADIYGLGSSLFYALTARAPFRAAALAVLITLKATCEAPSLGDATGRRWPDDIEAFMAGMLVREPAARFASAADARRAVERLLAARRR